MSTDLAVISQQPQSLIALIAEAAKDPNVDAAKMRELWALTREISEQDAKGAFYRAMQAVQEDIRPVLRSSKGQNSRYARLEAIDKAIRPIYTHRGFSLTFGAKSDVPGMLTITCECLHRDGHTSHYELPGALDAGNKAKSDIQALGSTVTYLRRYLTCLIFNVVFTDDEDDNDGAPGTITQDQADNIRDLIDACEQKDKHAGSAFRRFMGVERNEDIRAHEHTKAMTALSAKHRQLFGVK